MSAGVTQTAVNHLENLLAGNNAPSTPEKGIKCERDTPRFGTNVGSVCGFKTLTDVLSRPHHSPMFIKNDATDFTKSLTLSL